MTGFVSVSVADPDPGILLRFRSVFFSRIRIRDFSSIRIFSFRIQVHIFCWIRIQLIFRVGFGSNFSWSSYRVFSRMGSGTSAPRSAAFRPVTAGRCYHLEAWLVNYSLDLTKICMFSSWWNTRINTNFVRIQGISLNRWKPQLLYLQS